MSSNVQLVKSNGTFRLIDNDDKILKTHKVNRFLDRYQSFFKDRNSLVLCSDLNYIQFTEFIEKLKDRLNGYLEIGQEIHEFIKQNSYQTKFPNF